MEKEKHRKITKIILYILLVAVIIAAIVLIIIGLIPNNGGNNGGYCDSDEGCTVGNSLINLINLLN